MVRMHTRIAEIFTELSTRDELVKMIDDVIAEVEPELRHLVTFDICRDEDFSFIGVYREMTEAEYQAHPKPVTVRFQDGPDYWLQGESDAP